MTSVEIKNSLDLLLELIYINGVLNGKEMPEAVNLNALILKLKELVEPNEKPL